MAEHSEEPHSDHHAATKDSHPESGANFTTKLIAHTAWLLHLFFLESAEPTSPVVDPAIEAMYSVIPKEHREAKRKKNEICIQQYDDIDLPPLESRKQSDGSHLQVSVTMEGDSDEYSRLCHVGPRMNQTRKHSHPQPGYEQLVHDDAGKRDHSYSEVTCPTSKATVPNVVGKHSDADVPCNAVPLPPKHINPHLPSPVENLPNICVITASDEFTSSTSCPTPYKNVASLATMDS